MTSKSSENDFGDVVDAIRQGDEAATTQLTMELFPDLLAFAERNGVEDASAVTGEVLVNSFRNIALFQGDRQEFVATLQRVLLSAAPAPLGDPTDRVDAVTLLDNKPPQKPNNKITNQFPALTNTSGGADYSAEGASRSTLGSGTVLPTGRFVMGAVAIALILPLLIIIGATSKYSTTTDEGPTSDSEGTTPLRPVAASSSSIDPLPSRNSATKQDASIRETPPKSPEPVVGRKADQPEPETTTTTTTPPPPDTEPTPQPKPEPQPEPEPEPEPQPPIPPQNCQVILFQHWDFVGSRIGFVGDQPRLPAGQFSSVLAGCTVALYTGDNFTGSCTTVNRSRARFRDPLNDNVASVRVNTTCAQASGRT